MMAPTMRAAMGRRSPALEPAWAALLLWWSMWLVLVSGSGDPDGLVRIQEIRIQECPTHCRCLEKGSILTCRRMGLRQVPPLLSTTLFLDLDQNQVSVLHNVSFRNVPRLEILSLENNGLMYLESGAFGSLPELRILRLGRNYLSSLPRNVFWNNRYIEVLDISQNLFTLLPDYVFYHLHNLRALNVSFNRLESPRLGPGFKYTTQVTSLDFTGNTFLSLEAGVFQVLQTWETGIRHHLNLSRCGITHIHPRSFRRILNIESLSLAGNQDLPHRELQAALHELQTSNLEFLNLSHMNITDVFEFFRTFQHQNLLGLELSFNKIETIRRGTFFYLVNLLRLDLSHNAISSIEDLSSLNQLNYLNLAFNDLRYLEATAFESLHYLRELDLSHNALTELEDTPFQTLFDLQSLDISCNEVSVIRISVSLESLDTLVASQNKISDLGFIQRLRLLRSLDVSRNIVTRLGAPLFAKGHRFRMVNISGNSLYEIHPLAFLDSFIDHLDLSRNQLTSLTDIGWRNIRTLDLSRNKIYNMTASAFAGLESLESLDLSDNQLYALPRDSLRHLYSLQHLDLSVNPLGGYLLLPDVVTVIGLRDIHNLETLRLSRIGLPKIPTTLLANLSSLASLDLSENRLVRCPSGALAGVPRLRWVDLSRNAIAKPDPDAFRKMNKLRVVDLSGNPFDCTCALMPFRAWAVASLSLSLGETGLPAVHNIHNSTHYHCAGPAEWKDVAILDFHLDSSACAGRADQAVIFTAAGCVVLALGLALTVAILRYKWWQRKKAMISAEYTFIDDSSSSALTGGSNGSTMQMNNAPQPQPAARTREWV